MTTTTLVSIQPQGITAAKAFVRNADALAPNGNASSVAYGAVNTNLLTVEWTDLADGDYDCILYYGATAGPADILRVAGATAELLGDREGASQAGLDTLATSLVNNTSDVY